MMMPKVVFLLCFMPKYIELLYTWFGLKLEIEWVSGGTERPPQNDINGNIFNVADSKGG